MIDTITKFKMETRDWPFVIEFERTNEDTDNPELLTLRTGTPPKIQLRQSALKVARAALRYHGLDLISETDSQTWGVGFSLSS